MKVRRETSKNKYLPKSHLLFRHFTSFLLSHSIIFKCTNRTFIRYQGYSGAINYYHSIWEDEVEFIWGVFSLFLLGGQQDAHSMPTSIVHCKGLKSVCEAFSTRETWREEAMSNPQAICCSSIPSRHAGHCCSLPAEILCSFPFLSIPFPSIPFPSIPFMGKHMTGTHAF